MLSNIKRTYVYVVLSIGGLLLFATIIGVHQKISIPSTQSTHTQQADAPEALCAPENENEHEDIFFVNCAAFL